MKENTQSKGVSPLNVLQIGCGAFGVHLERHLKSRVSSLTLVAGRSQEWPLLDQFDLVFLAVDDRSLIRLVPDLLKRGCPSDKLIHFSGFHFFEGVLGLHPVQSFSKQSQYDLNQIDFVVDGKLSAELRELFSKVHFIKPEAKKDYHTYMSVLANSLQLFVHQVGKDFERDMNLPSNLLRKLVFQSLLSEQSLGEQSFSGPWARGSKDIQDEQVLKMKSATLKNLNQSFVKEIDHYKKTKKTLLDEVLI